MTSASDVSGGPNGIEADYLRGESAKRAQSLAWWAAIAGFLPFGVLALLLLVTGKESAFYSTAADALKTYAAIILSFLGGIRWGSALRLTNSDRAAQIYILSVIGPLIGWVALFISEPVSFGLMALAFAVHGAWDSFSGTRAELPSWFVRLRMILTALVVSALSLAFIATA
ncbi:MAG: DUF3429 domain-containing protein [Pseudomonadota bacterium]